MLEWNQDQIIKCFAFPETIYLEYFEIFEYRDRYYQKTVISGYWLQKHHVQKYPERQNFIYLWSKIPTNCT